MLCGDLQEPLLNRLFMRPFKSIVSLHIIQSWLWNLWITHHVPFIPLAWSHSSWFSSILFYIFVQLVVSFCFSQSGLCFFYSVRLGDVWLVNNRQPGSRSEYKLLEKNRCLVWESKYHGGMVRNSHSIISFMCDTGNTECTMAKTCNRLSLEKLLPHRQFLTISLQLVT